MKPLTGSPKPSSAALKSYLQQVGVAHDRYLALQGDFVTVLAQRSTTSSSAQGQPTDKDDQSDAHAFASSAEGQKVLHLLERWQSTTRSFRTFNPVPRSAAKVDAQFVQFSLKMDQALDLYRLYIALPDEDTLGDKASKKMDEALASWSLATQGLLALKQSVDAQAVHKTYVPG